MITDGKVLRVTTALKAKKKEPRMLAEAAVYPVAKHPRVTAQSTPPFCYCLRRARLKVCVVLCVFVCVCVCVCVSV